MLFLHIYSSNSVQATFTEGESMSAPKHIIRQAKDASLPITMRVGKSGLSDSVVVELEGQLSSRSLVKVKVNRGLYTKDDLNTVWNIMAEKTNSSIVFARGNVAVFWRN